MHANDRVFAANSLLLTASALLLAFFPALLLGRQLVLAPEGGARAGLWGVCLGSLVVPLYLHAAAWMCLLGPGGWTSRQLAWPVLLQRWPGAIWVHAMAVLPQLAMGMALAWSVVPGRVHELLLQECANPVQRLTAQLRVVASGVVLALLWGGILINTDMTATDIFRVRTLLEVFYAEMASTGDGSQKALVMLPGVLMMAALILAGWVTVRSVSTDWTCAWDSVARPSSGLHGGVLSQVPMFLMLGAPLAGLAYRAGSASVQSAAGGWRLEWSWGEFFSNTFLAPSRFWQEIQWTLLISLPAAALATALASLGAWYSMRSPKVYTLGGIFVSLGLAVPGPVLATTVIWFVNQPVPLLAWLYDSTVFAAVVTLTLKLLPLAWLGCEMAWSSLPTGIRELSALEGAGPLHTLVSVALPMRKGALLCVGALTMLFAAGDVSASILVLPPGVCTIAYRVFDRLHTGADQQVAGLCLMLWLTMIGAGWAIGCRVLRSRS